MATSGVSGLSSGIDTTSLISSLMQAAAGPQLLLKSKLSRTNTVISALQKINTQTASVATTATALAKATTWTATKATSSSTGVTTATTGSPTTGSLTFNVTATAAAHSALSGVVSGGTASPITITHSDGTSASFTPSSGSAADIVSAINTGDTSVTATVVSDSAGQHVLITSKATGAGSSFTTTGLATSVLRQGTDAELDLGNGVLVHSAKNTFTGLMSGVDVTVSKLENDVTVSVGQDSAGVTSQVSDLVSSLNTLLANIAYQTKASPSTAAGTASTDSGPLVGDSTSRELRNRLLDVVSHLVGTDSTAVVGIQNDRDGNITFDKDAFSAYLASNPAKAQSIVTGLAQEVAGVAKAASDPYTGSVSQLIKGQQSTATDLTARIADWDDRLALRQSTLQSQFTAMETALSNLQSQSSALTNALKSLTSSS